MPFLPVPMASPATSPARRILNAALAILFLAGIAYICAFKLIDRDFWWHIKAGEIMWDTGRLIHTDPFAWTRAGLPYLSNREWLAEVILFLFYRAGGSTAVILLRTLLAACAFGVLLLIAYRRTAWPLALLVFWGAYASRPSLMERPQLFTFLLFGIFLFLAFRMLERKDDTSFPRALLAMPLLQLVWVNVHGAASILGLVVAGCLLLQLAAERRWGMARTLLWTLGAMLFASLLSPETYRMFSDLWMLTHDPAIRLVKEWQPFAIGSYAATYGAFWIAALGALAWTRRTPVFCLLILLILGAMSLQSFRHIILFVQVACAVTIFQLAGNARFQAFLQALARHPAIAAAGTLVFVLLVAFAVQAQDVSAVRRRGFFGYGEAPMAADAYAFLERANVGGKMFNSYNLGSYLLNRGYPSRPVFVDGRNVEHGFERLNASLAAAAGPEAWEQLERQYGFTYAVMDVQLTPGREGIGFAHLAGNPRWVLVFLDDVSMVYVKDIPENQDVIRAHAYRRITPESVELGAVWEGAAARRPDIEAELLRSGAASPGSVKARLLLAQSYRETGRVTDALRVLEEARAAQPDRPEVYEQLGLSRVALGQWAQAGALFEEAIARTGGAGPPVNYAFLSGVFQNAGDARKAAYYGAKARR